MNWAAWSDFAAMGTHGVFVWSALGLCGIGVAMEALMLRARMRRLLAPATPEDAA
jgi:heme exporter protein D